MQPCKIRGTTPSHARGWKARKYLLLPVEGENALDFPSYRSGVITHRSRAVDGTSMSEIEIYQQLSLRVHSE
jgi:hypothetical protein